MYLASISQLEALAEAERDLKALVRGNTAGRFSRMAELGERSALKDKIAAAKLGVSETDRLGLAKEEQALHRDVQQKRAEALDAPADARQRAQHDQNMLAQAQLRGRLDTIAANTTPPPPVEEVKVSAEQEALDQWGMERASAVNILSTELAFDRRRGVFTLGKSDFEKFPISYDVAVGYPLFLQLMCLPSSALDGRGHDDTDNTYNQAIATSNENASTQAFAYVGELLIHGVRLSRTMHKLVMVQHYFPGVIELARDAYDSGALVSKLQRDGNAAPGAPDNLGMALAPDGGKGPIVPSRGRVKGPRGGDPARRRPPVP